MIPGSADFDTTIDLTDENHPTNACESDTQHSNIPLEGRESSVVHSLCPSNMREIFEAIQPLKTIAQANFQSVVCLSRKSKPS